MQFLILARVAQGVSIEQVLPHVKAEAEAVWQQYSVGIVRSIYYIADMSGAVLLCEAPNQRYGYGTQLARKVISSAIEQGAISLEINVLPDNKAALYFWQSLGFSLHLYALKMDL